MTPEDHAVARLIVYKRIRLLADEAADLRLSGQNEGGDVTTRKRQPACPAAEMR